MEDGLHQGENKTKFLSNQEITDDMDPMLERTSAIKFRFQDTDSRKITKIIHHLGKSDYQSSRVLVGFMPADDIM